MTPPQTLALKPHNSYADLAPYFGVHQETVERWARAGRFGTVLKVGNTVRISRRAVEAFEAAHATELGAGAGGMYASAPTSDDLAPDASSRAPNPNRRQGDERGVGPLRAAALRRSA